MTSRIRRHSLLGPIVAVATACGAATAVGGPPPSAPPGGAVITASNIAFDRAELVVPSDHEFPLVFENRESAPHNVSVVDEASGQALFTGEIFGGVDSRTYLVPAIPPGTYRFLCDVHPTMAGTLIAAAIAAAPAVEAAAAPAPAPEPAFP